jgi:organic hydroperoxide reductase OsmC/OhrA
MDKLPHRYRVEAKAAERGGVMVEGETLQPIETDSPRQFGGRGDRWSPETMLAGSVASCFILTFRAMAEASSFPWEHLSCAVEARLDRVEGVLRFVELSVRPTLAIPAGGGREKARRLLEKAERGCPVANSLLCPLRLEPEIVEAPAGSAIAH